MVKQSEWDAIKDWTSFRLLLPLFPYDLGLRFLAHCWGGIKRGGTVGVTVDK